MSTQPDLFSAPPPAPAVTLHRGWYHDHNCLLGILLEGLEWQQHTMTMRGQRIPMPRMECFYGPSGSSYSYSGMDHPALDLASAPPALRYVVEEVADVVGEPFNAMFANWYRHGSDSIGWHADDEPVLGSPLRSVIASLSLGARRTFSLRETCNPSNRHGWTLAGAGPSRGAARSDPDVATAPPWGPPRVLEEPRGHRRASSPTTGVHP